MTLLTNSSFDAMNLVHVLEQLLFVCRKCLVCPTDLDGSRNYTKQCEQ